MRGRNWRQTMSGQRLGCCAGVLLLPSVARLPRKPLLQGPSRPSGADAHSCPMHAAATFTLVWHGKPRHPSAGADSGLGCRGFRDVGGLRLRLSGLGFPAGDGSSSKPHLVIDAFISFISMSWTTVTLANWSSMSIMAAVSCG